MADVMSTKQRSMLMSRILGRDTEPELKLRRAIWALGLRYRLHLRIGRFKPDLVFLRARVAVFVDGCFWHRCPTHGVMPKGNQDFWRLKLERNVQRDMETTQKLTQDGWKVLRFWEHEIKAAASDCARLVADTVADRLSGSGSNR